MYLFQSHMQIYLYFVETHKAQSFHINNLEKKNKQ